MNQTSIEWTDTTWNPVTGCTKVSAGCKNCYAEGVAHRFWSKQYPPVVVDVDGAKIERPRRFTDVLCHEDRLAEPLHWRKPRRVFVNSMSDLFHEDVPDEFIAAVFGVMAAAREHTFQVLTKRPERMRRWFDWVQSEPELGCSAGAYCAEVAEDKLAVIGRPVCYLPDGPWPLPNVWLGVSVEDQRAADERIPLLLRTPAAVRFLSCEPLLGPIGLPRPLGKTRTLHLRACVDGMLRSRWFRGLTDEDGHPLTEKESEQRLRELLASGVQYLPFGECDGFDPSKGCPGHLKPGIDWVIVGGESGPGARPCDVAWVRSIVEQCKAAGVPAFVKQLGAHITGDLPSYGTVHRWMIRGYGWCTAPLIGPFAGVRPDFSDGFQLCNSKGGDPAEWPEDLRVREFPA